MTLQELKTKADIKLSHLWKIITSKQELYFAKNGRYWQGILTPSNIPIDGIDSDLDLTKKPSHQNEDWSFLELPINLKIPFQIRVDTYKCPNGSHGFQVTVFVSVEGAIYSRSKGIGEEAINRDYNWTEIINEEI